jgi:hypothetical protein
MRETIIRYIRFCNAFILAWYAKTYPIDLDDFTPVEPTDELIDLIQQMCVVGEADVESVVVYYFTLAAVEYYVLDGCPLFRGTITGRLVELSSHSSLAIYRKKCMGFNLRPYSGMYVK